MMMMMMMIHVPRLGRNLQQVDTTATAAAILMMILRNCKGWPWQLGDNFHLVVVIVVISIVITAVCCAISSVGVAPRCCGTSAAG